MVVFIDTSSLVKRYIEEPGSNVVDRYFNEENTVCISPVTQIEMRSVFKRKLLEGSIDQETYQKAIGFWNIDIDHFSINRLNNDLTIKAVSIIDSHGVKTLDAIQIGSAMLSEAEEYITSDSQMNRIFQSFDNIKTTFI
jgi:predicted nucleic acid-binding protein